MICLMTSLCTKNKVVIIAVSVVKIMVSTGFGRPIDTLHDRAFGPLQQSGGKDHVRIDRKPDQHQKCFATPAVLNFIPVRLNMAKVTTMSEKAAAITATLGIKVRK